MSEPFDLRKGRINAGYSVRRLARRLGIHEHTIRRLEAGEAVRPEKAKPVADFFHVKVTDLPGMEVPADV